MSSQRAVGHLGPKPEGDRSPKSAARRLQINEFSVCRIDGMMSIVQGPARSIRLIRGLLESPTLAGSFKDTFYKTPHSARWYVPHTPSDIVAAVTQLSRSTGTPFAIRVSRAAPTTPAPNVAASTPAADDDDAQPMRDAYGYCEHPACQIHASCSVAAQTAKYDTTFNAIHDTLFPATATSTSGSGQRPTIPNAIQGDPIATALWCLNASIVPLIR